MKRDVLTVPRRVGARWDMALMTGEVTITGDQVQWEVDFGPAEFQLEAFGQVKVAIYPDKILYHGNPA